MNFRKESIMEKEIKKLLKATPNGVPKHFVASNGCRVELIVHNFSERTIMDFHRALFGERKAS